MVMSRVARALTGAFIPTPPPLAPEWREDPIGLYRLLRAYYSSNGLYDDLQAYAIQRSAPLPARRALRNPAHRVVEFYVTHLWPAVLEVLSDNEAIKEPIAQVWKWSNWEANQRLAARLFAMQGDLFVKVASQPTIEGAEPTDEAPGVTAQEGRVWFEILDPETVIDYDEDTRHFLTYVHIEVDRMERVGDDLVQVYITEIWDKAQGLRLWRNDRRLALKDLGAPTEVTPLADFGIDFIPITHAKFQDVGFKRGAAAFTHALEKIDEVNLQATRLHQLIFKDNQVTWAVTAGGNDNSGRPLPAVRPAPANDPNASRQPDWDGTLEFGGERMVSLPGNAELTSLVPSLAYEAALKIIEAQMLDIEHDLPELSFYRVQELGEISGKAVRLLLSDAIDKIMEARGNAFQLLARADMMALTIAAALQLENFTTLGGNFDAGDFDHTFVQDEPISISEQEQAESDLAVANAAIMRHESGWSWRATLRDRGFTDDQIAEMEQEREDEANQAVEQQQRLFDAGQGVQDNTDSQPPENQ